MFAQLAPPRSANSASLKVAHKIATTRAEREGAFRVVYDAYLEAGLCQANPWGIRVTPYHLLDTTATFIALEQGEVVSTISLVGDGDYGLPMESIYPREVEERRQQGLRLGEVSCLADYRPDSRCSLPRFCELARIMVQYARFHELDQILVAVHPKQQRFYTRCLWFEPIGGVTVYPTVRNRPAVALCMDFTQVDRKGLECPERHERFFGQPIPASQLQAQPMSAWERNYFRERIDPAFDLADYELQKAATRRYTRVEAPGWSLLNALAASPV